MMNAFCGLGTGRMIVVFSMLSALFLFEANWAAQDQPFDQSEVYDIRTVEVGSTTRVLPPFSASNFHVIANTSQSVEVLFLFQGQTFGPSTSGTNKIVRIVGLSECPASWLTNGRPQAECIIHLRVSDCLFVNTSLELSLYRLSSTANSSTAVVPLIQIRNNTFQNHSSILLSGQERFDVLNFSASTGTYRETLGKDSEVVISMNKILDAGNMMFRNLNLEGGAKIVVRENVILATEQARSSKVLIRTHEDPRTSYVLRCYFIQFQFVHLAGFGTALDISGNRINHDFVDTLGLAISLIRLAHTDGINQASITIARNKLRGLYFVFVSGIWIAASEYQDGVSLNLLENDISFLHMAYSGPSRGTLRMYGTVADQIILRKSSTLNVNSNTVVAFGTGVCWAYALTATSAYASQIHFTNNTASAGGELASHLHVFVVVYTNIYHDAWLKIEGNRADLGKNFVRFVSGMALHTSTVLIRRNEFLNSSTPIQTLFNFEAFHVKHGSSLVVSDHVFEASSHHFPEKLDNRHSTVGFRFDRCHVHEKSIVLIQNISTGTDAALITHKKDKENIGYGFYFANLDLRDSQWIVTECQLEVKSIISLLNHQYVVQNQATFAYFGPVVAAEGSVLGVWDNKGNIEGENASVVVFREGKGTLELGDDSYFDVSGNDFVLGTDRVNWKSELHHSYLTFVALDVVNTSEAAHTMITATSPSFSRGTISFASNKVQWNASHLLQGRRVELRFISVVVLATPITQDKLGRTLQWICYGNDLEFKGTVEGTSNVDTIHTPFFIGESRSEGINISIAENRIQMENGKLAAERKYAVLYLANTDGTSHNHFFFTKNTFEFIGTVKFSQLLRLASQKDTTCSGPDEMKMKFFPICNTVGTSTPYNIFSVCSYTIFPGPECSKVHCSVIPFCHKFDPSTTNCQLCACRQTETATQLSKKDGCAPERLLPALPEPPRRTLYVYIGGATFGGLDYTSRVYMHRFYPFDNHDENQEKCLQFARQNGFNALVLVDPTYNGVHKLDNFILRARREFGIVYVDVGIVNYYTATALGAYAMYQNNNRRLDEAKFDGFVTFRANIGQIVVMQGRNPIPRKATGRFYYSALLRSIADLEKFPLYLVLADRIIVRPTEVDNPFSLYNSAGCSPVVARFAEHLSNATLLNAAYDAMQVPVPVSERSKPRKIFVDVVANFVGGFFPATVNQDSMLGLWAYGGRFRALDHSAPGDPVGTVSREVSADAETHIRNLRNVHLQKNIALFFGGTTMLDYSYLSLQMHFPEWRPKLKATLLLNCTAPATTRSPLSSDRTATPAMPTPLMPVSKLFTGISRTMDDPGTAVFVDFEKLANFSIYPSSLAAFAGNTGKAIFVGTTIRPQLHMMNLTRQEVEAAELPVRSNLGDDAGFGFVKVAGASRAGFKDALDSFAAEFLGITGLALDALHHRIVIADGSAASNTQHIRAFSLQTGAVWTLAGNGSKKYAHNESDPLRTSSVGCHKVAVFNDSIFFTERRHHTIRVLRNNASTIHLLVGVPGKSANLHHNNGFELLPNGTGALINDVGTLSLLPQHEEVYFTLRGGRTIAACTFQGTNLRAIASAVRTVGDSDSYNAETARVTTVASILIHPHSNILLISDSTLRQLKLLLPSNYSTQRQGLYTFAGNEAASQALYYARSAFDVFEDPNYLVGKIRTLMLDEETGDVYAADGQTASISKISNFFCPSVSYQTQPPSETEFNLTSILNLTSDAVPTILNVTLTDLVSGPNSPHTSTAIDATDPAASTTTATTQTQPNSEQPTSLLENQTEWATEDSLLNTTDMETIGPSPGSNATNETTAPPLPTLENATSPATPGPTVAKGGVASSSSSAALTMVLSKEGAEGVASSASVAAVGAGLASPTAASKAVRVGAALRSLDCVIENNDPEEGPSVVEMPVQFSIGYGEFPKFAGAALATTAIFLVLPFAIWQILWRTAKSKAKDETGRKEKGTAPPNHVPLKGSGIVFSVCLLYFVPAVGGVSALLLVHGSSTERAIAVVCLLVATGLVGWTVRLIAIDHLFQAKVRRGKGVEDNSESDSDASSADGSETSSGDNTSSSSSSSSSTSTSSSSNSASDTNGGTKLEFVNTQPGSCFVEASSSLFDGTSNVTTLSTRLYLFEDLCVAVAMAVVSSIKVGQCTTIAVLTTVLSLLHVIYLFYVRPYRTKLDTVFTALSAVLQLLLGLLVIYSAAINQSSALVSQVIGYVVLAVFASFFVETFVQAYWAYHRHSKHAVELEMEQSTAGVEMDDKGADSKNAAAAAKKKKTARKKKNQNDTTALQVPLLDEAGSSSPSSSSSSSSDEDDETNGTMQNPLDARV